jgi:hypothetical protein
VTGAMATNAGAVRGTPVSAEPVFILAPYRSFTSVACAMLGEHPAMYGLPEVNLFSVSTMLEWWAVYRGGHALGGHGLLRAVAELCYGQQSGASIRAAQRWIWLRLELDSATVFDELVARVLPLRLVDKSPTMVYQPDALRRVLRAFPRARFLHLLRHPGSFADSLMALPMGRLWLEREGFSNFDTIPPTLDPGAAWCRAHRNIDDFLSSLPGWQQRRIRGEDLLADPVPHLTAIATWLGLQADPAAIEAMQHPERSPFANIGPPGAPLGNAPSFLQRPWLQDRSTGGRGHTGRVGRQTNQPKLSVEVQELAARYGYS